MTAEEGGKSQPEFGKDQCEPLIDLALSDSTELWLIQWPYKQDLDFDGQEVSILLDQDGTLGSFSGTSGKEYEVVSYKCQDVDATIFASSASESKVVAVGKISRRVSFVHYPEPSELEMYDPDKVKEERDRELYEWSVKYAASRNLPSMSRSALMTAQNGWSRQTYSSRSSKQRSTVSDVDAVCRSSGKIQPLGSSDISTKFTSSQQSKLSKVKQEQE